MFYESKKTGKPIVFLFHPTELLDPEKKVITTRRSNNPIEHIFADVVRQRLKFMNLGENGVKLMDATLRSAVASGFEFTTAKEYAKIYK